MPLHCTGWGSLLRGKASRWPRRQRPKSIQPPCRRKGGSGGGSGGGAMHRTISFQYSVHKQHWQLTLRATRPRARLRQCITRIHLHHELPPLCDPFSLCLFTVWPLLALTRRFALTRLGYLGKDCKRKPFLPSALFFEFRIIDILGRVKGPLRL